ncbi:MAG: class I SAM-dependent methyltransferase [Candidatus Omnitrophota bacterium]
MTDSLSTTIKQCRICGSREINSFLELGAQPPANSLRARVSELLPRFPLTLCRCANCTAVQLTETVKPEHLFRHYVWVTGTSATAKSYSGLFYTEAAKRFKKSTGLVVEVASNDGTFLGVFKDNGWNVLGVDPAENIAKIANDRGVNTLCDFFGDTVARQILLKEGPADFVFARNVIPHVADVHDVIAGIKRCMHPQGTGAIEFHYAGGILEGLQYDSIYHEHLFYYSLKSIQFLLARHGLYAFDLIDSPISGGSLVLYISHSGDKKLLTDKLMDAMAAEESSGLNTLATWEKFSRDCRDHKRKLTAIIAREKGKVVIGYGASARSSTLLNYCAINKDHLVCIADQNPLKHNTFTAGTDIPIVSPRDAFSKKPDAVLLLAWNFKEEIMALLKNKYHFHGRVIFPLANDPQVVSL